MCLINEMLLWLKKGLNYIEALSDPEKIEISKQLPKKETRILVVQVQWLDTSSMSKEEYVLIYTRRKGQHTMC